MGSSLWYLRIYFSPFVVNTCFKSVRRISTIDYWLVFASGLRKKNNIDRKTDNQWVKETNTGCGLEAAVKLLGLKKRSNLRKFILQFIVFRHAELALVGTLVKVAQKLSVFNVWVNIVLWEQTQTPVICVCKCGINDGFHSIRRGGDVHRNL